MAKNKIVLSAAGVAARHISPKLDGFAVRRKMFLPEGTHSGSLMVGVYSLTRGFMLQDVL